MKKYKWLGIGVSLTLLIVSAISYLPVSGAGKGSPFTGPKYVVIAWNNLGMHCYDPDFSNLCILPPYNTLMAQVIKVGNPPQLVTSGITVEYSFPDNTFSVNQKGRPDKSNFWSYAQQLFKLPAPLPPNIGLTGKGLTGTFDLSKDGTYWVAEGIPLTDILDRDAVTQKIYPFQKAQVVVRSQNSKGIMAQLTVVAPVSTELSCANCHSDTGDATTGAMYPDHAITPTGKVETNILALHDKLNGMISNNYAKLPADKKALTPLMQHQPVMCADCHSDNAVGMAGVTDVKSLSNAMHAHHNPSNAPDITPTTDGCYNCHPGPVTQCLRDTMSQNFSLGCVDCHGDIVQVAKNPNPWLNEPKCSNTGCHGTGYNTTSPLFQLSTGHGGLYCEACHDSTHAVAPSREANDAIKFIQLQGHAGTLSDCTVCHATKPTAMFKHT